jgi:hypothetical protein
MTARGRTPISTGMARALATLAWVGLVGGGCTPSPPAASIPQLSSSRKDVVPRVHQKPGGLETKALRTQAGHFEACAERTEEYCRREFLRYQLQGQMGASGTLRGMQSARAKAPQRLGKLAQRSAAGDSAAMYELGVIAESGWGQSDSSSVWIACKWFRQAGELGHTGAMVELALLYSSGYPSTHGQEPDGASRLLERAASLGDEEAAWRLKALRAREALALR